MNAKMNNGNFRYEYYNCLLHALATEGYSTMSFLDKEKYSRKNKLLLRHDVDFHPYGALKMAETEVQNDMYSTWCFLMNSPLYNVLSEKMVKLICALNEMGHWCCMHIDASSYRSFEDMCMDTERQFSFYSQYLPLVRAVSFHRPLPNMLEDMVIPGFVGAYEKRFFSEITYVSDSNRRAFWAEDRLKEAVKQACSIQLLTHPMWWGENELDEMGACDRLKQVSSTIVDDTLVNNCNFFKQLRENVSL